MARAPPTIGAQESSGKPLQLIAGSPAERCLGFRAYRRHPIVLGGASCVFFAGQSGQPPRPSDQKEASVTTQALFIGLDAADKDLLLEWAHAGHLPHIRALLGRAAWGVTRNPLGLFVGAVWPSFYTGVSPARHGRYCYT
jgi:hypothetical protein